MFSMACGKTGLQTAWCGHPAHAVGGRTAHLGLGPGVSGAGGRPADWVCRVLPGLSQRQRRSLWGLSPAFPRASVSPEALPTQGPTPPFLAPHLRSRALPCGPSRRVNGRALTWSVSCLCVHCPQDELTVNFRTDRTARGPAQRSSTGPGRGCLGGWILEGAPVTATPAVTCFSRSHAPETPDPTPTPGCPLALGAPLCCLGPRHH